MIRILAVLPFIAIAISLSPIAFSQNHNICGPDQSCWWCPVSPDRSISSGPCFSEEEQCNAFNPSCAYVSQDNAPAELPNSALTPGARTCNESEEDCGWCPISSNGTVLANDANSCSQNEGQCRAFNAACAYVPVSY